ncbi:MAG: hypothetical protein AAF846_23400 [Chloroflexota bacterium]
MPVASASVISVRRASCSFQPIDIIAVNGPVMLADSATAFNRTGDVFASVWLLVLPLLQDLESKVAGKGYITRLVTFTLPGVQHTVLGIDIYLPNAGPQLH